MPSTLGLFYSLISESVMDVHELTHSVDNVGDLRTNNYDILQCPNNTSIEMHVFDWFTAKGT